MINIIRGNKKFKSQNSKVKMRFHFDFWLLTFYFFVLASEEKSIKQTNQKLPPVAAQNLLVVGYSFYSNKECPIFASAMKMKREKS